MANKKYVSFGNLSSFLNNLKNLFATKIEMNDKSDKSHNHSISDITNLQTTLERRQIILQTENLSTLKIHSLSKEQYERELAAGRLEENALYLTPDDETYKYYVTIDLTNMSCDATINSIEKALTSDKQIIAKIIFANSSALEHYQISYQNVYYKKQADIAPTLGF
jgi:hypothetical protein